MSLIELVDIFYELVEKGGFEGGREQVNLEKIGEDGLFPMFHSLFPEISKKVLEVIFGGRITKYIEVDTKNELFTVKVEKKAEGEEYYVVLGGVHCTCMEFNNAVNKKGGKGGFVYCSHTLGVEIAKRLKKKYFETKEINRGEFYNKLRI